MRAAVCLLFVTSALGLAVPRDVPIYPADINLHMTGVASHARDGIVPIGAKLRIGHAGASKRSTDDLPLIRPIGANIRVGHAGASKRSTDSHSDTPILPIGANIRIGHAGASKRSTDAYPEVEVETDENELDVEAGIPCAKKAEVEIGSDGVEVEVDNLEVELSTK